MSASAWPPPFEVGAVVLEEDTHLVSSAPSALSLEDAPSPLRVLTAAKDTEPLERGAVVVRRGAPHRLLAVVHDFDAQPTCERAAARAALERALEVATSLGVRGLALPLLGAAHGGLSLDAACEVVTGALEARAGALVHVWLVVDEARQPAVARWFAGRR